MNFGSGTEGVSRLPRQACTAKSRLANTRSPRCRRCSTGETCDERRARACGSRLRARHCGRRCIRMGKTIRGRRVCPRRGEWSWGTLFSLPFLGLLLSRGYLNAQRFRRLRCSGLGVQSSGVPTARLPRLTVVILCADIHCVSNEFMTLQAPRCIATRWVKNLPHVRVAVNDVRIVSGGVWVAPMDLERL